MGLYRDRQGRLRHSALDQVDKQGGGGAGSDADTLDGLDSTAFALASHSHAPSDITPQGAGSGLNADLLDGLSSTAFALSSHSHAATDIGAGTVDDTEFGYLNGVTSAIQTQFSGKQPLDADLTAIAALAGTGFLAHTGAGTWAERTLQAGAGISISNPAGIAGDPSIASTITQYTDELAQDAIGAALTDSTTIDFTYTDASNQITADVIQAALDHGSIGGLTDDDHIGYTRLAGRTSTTNDTTLSTDADGSLIGSGTTAKDLLIYSNSIDRNTGNVTIDSEQAWRPSFPTTLGAGPYYLARFAPAGPITIGATTQLRLIDLSMPTLSLTGVPTNSFAALLWSGTIEHTGDASSSLYSYNVMNVSLHTKATGATSSPMYPDCFVDNTTSEFAGSGTATNPFAWQAISYLGVHLVESTGGGTLNGVRSYGLYNRQRYDVDAGSTITVLRRAGMVLWPFHCKDGFALGDSLAALDFTGNGTVNVTDNCAIYVRAGQRETTTISGTKQLNVTRNSVIFNEMAASVTATENRVIYSTGTAPSSHVGKMALGVSTLPAEMLDVSGNEKITGAVMDANAPVAFDVAAGFFAIFSSELALTGTIEGAAESTGEILVI